MYFGSGLFDVGGGGGVRRMAAPMAPSRSPDATGPSDANQTSSIDRSRARIERATSVATRGAFSVSPRESESSALLALAGWSAFTGSASAPCSLSPAEHELDAHRLEILLRPPPRCGRVERAREPRQRVRKLGLAGVERASASAAAPPHVPSLVPVDTAVRRSSARSQQLASAPSAIIGSAVASWRSNAGRSMTSAHHAANGPSHSTSSTSPSAVPRVVSTSRQKERAQRPLERRR